uniref:Uncharacterized protein n=1 Tax=Proboscia inermis TaxID=420281 RepID=A0A7S0BY00_9STRA
MAKESDGPYVYAAFQRAGIHGPTSLDTGTNYGGCVDPRYDNAVIPEYSDVFDGGIVNQDVCTAQGLGAYVNRTSSQSIPAYAANTGVHCSGSSASSCLAKFHKNSGLPVWAIPKPDIFDFETTEDGIVVVGTTYDSPPSFDSVQIAAGVATLEGYGVMWQSKVDLNGNGIYVQPLISERSYGGGTGLTQDPNGNLFMTLYTTSPTTKLGPGAPGGWTLDLMTGVCGEEDAICEGEQRNLVTKLGDEMTPSCIASCGEDIEVTADNCFIDGVCYANGDSAIAIGLGCMVCNSGVSQTEWSEGPTIGTTACLIYNKCFADGTLLEVRVGRFEAVYSECQACIPSTNKYDWSIKEEYDLVSVSAVPPEDCSFKPTAIPTDAPTMAPVSPSTNFPTKNQVLAPTDKPIVSEEVGLSKASESSNDDDSLSNGAIAAIVFGCLVGFGVFAFFMAKRATGNNIEYQTNQ